MARASTRKTAYHHGDLRRALVTASIALIEESGVEALTLRAVAKRLGVSHAAPQHHFATKEALLGAIADEGHVALGEALARAARDGEPLDRLKAAGVAYVRFAARHPSHFRVMFGARRARAMGVEDVAYRVLVEASAAVAHERGVPEEARTISLAAWALVHGLATLWLDGPLRGAIPGAGELAKVAGAITELVGRALSGPA